MVTPSQNGPESQRYFGKAHHRHSPGAKKGSKQPIASSPQTSQQKPAVKSVKPQQPRQNPPHQRPNNKPSSPIMHFPTSPNQRQSRTSPSRFSFSSSTSSSSSPRSSPSNTPSRSSPNFASSTCYQPPTPSSLPKPPLSWTMSAPAILSPSTTIISPDPTTHLRLLLNVHA